MGSRIVKIEGLSGKKASIYTVYVDSLGKTLFDVFLEENFTSFKSETLNIRERLITIGEKTGAREQFFKIDEGNPGDGVCALYDDPESNLRLYCIRYGTEIIILGGGGHKPKSIRALQESKKLKDENYYLRKLSREITERIKCGDIYFTSGGIELDGEITFEDYED